MEKEGGARGSTAGGREGGERLLLWAVAELQASAEPIGELARIYQRLGALAGLEVFAHFEGSHDDRSACLAAAGLSDGARAQLGRGRLPTTSGVVPTAAVLEPVAAVLRAEGIRRLILHPLVDRGRRVGTLLFATAGEAPERPEAAAWVAALGAMVRMALERHRAEAVLQATADRHRTLFESVDEGVCVFQMIFDDAGEPVDYRFLEVNPRFEQQTGLRRAVGRTARELVPDLDASWFRIYGGVALTGEPARFENHAPAMGRWFEVNAVRVGAPAERQVALLFRDITERKRREEEVRDSERRFRLMADTAPAILWVTDTRGETTFISRGWYEYTGQQEGQGMGFGWLDVVHPEDRERAAAIFAGASAKQEAFALDYRLRGRDGTYRWAIDAGRPRFDEHGHWFGYIGSVIDAHDRKLAEERLLEADRRKDHFLAVLSHELRNPLAPLEAGLQILERSDPTGPRAARARRIMKRQVEQLARLVDDLLDVTRVTRDKVQLRRERLELNELVRRAVEDQRELFERAGVALSFTPAGRELFVDGDANRLTQVVGNLLHNSAKFTARGDRAAVALGVDEGSGQAVIRVEDSGRGMEPAAIAGLFEPFAQADDTLARSSGGLGLGLALVRGLVALHGGEVAAQSEGPGRGAQFIIRLPLASGPQPRLEVSPPRSAPRGLDVLVIEDSKDIAELMADLLRLEGHQVTTAANGPEGLEAARRVRPAAVLCDIGLPGMDGFEVARSLAADPRVASALRVAVSGYALPEDVERARAAGFHRHIAKPPDLGALREALAEAAVRGGRAQPSGDEVR